MAQYRLTARAEADPDRIWYYVARDNIQAAHHLIDTIVERFPTLAERPFMGRPRPELGSDLRSFPVGNHLIVYRPTDFGIVIVHFLDSRPREPDSTDLSDF